MYSDTRLGERNDGQMGGMDGKQMAVINGLDGWMGWFFNEWMAIRKERMDGWIDRWIGEFMSEQMVIRNGWVDGWVDGWRGL